MKKRLRIARHVGFLLRIQRYLYLAQFEMHGRFPWARLGERQEEGYRPVQPWFEVNVAPSRRTAGYSKDSQECAVQFYTVL